MISRYIFVLVSMFLFNHGMSAQNSARVEAIQYIQEGDNQMRMANIQGAEFSYTNAIQADVTFADAYMKRALLYQVLGRYQEAMADYNTAISLNPYSEYIFDKRSKLKMLENDYKGALDDINKAITINPLNTEYVSYRIEDYIALGRYDDALNDNLQLIASQGETNTNYEQQAVIYLLKDDLPSGLESIERALELNPFSAEAHDLKGVFQLKRNNLEAALSSFSKAIELNPSFGIAYYNRAIVYRSLGDAEAALNDLNTSLEVSRKESNVYFMRGLIRKEMGDFQGAVADYDKALLVDSSFVDARYNKAFTLKYLGNYSTALDEANLIVRVEPDSPENWNLKGNIELLYGQFDEAIESFSRALDQDGYFHEALYNRGLTYLMSYRPIQGCRDLRKVVGYGFEEGEKAFQNFCGN